MNKPLINWEGLRSLTMPPPPPQPQTDGPRPHGYGAWDNQAEFYDRMAKMEAGFTLNQINCFDTAPTDTVLDLGCGPGRITVPMAARSARVTAMDSSPKMLEKCAANAAAAGRENVDTLLLDWNEVEPGVNLQKHDIVICSRSAALGDIEKMTQLANKYVVNIIWSHGFPSIPAIIARLFAGTGEEMRAGPPMNRDRRLGNNVFYNIIYDKGYEPNLRVVEDGFTKNYPSRQAAYDDLRTLRPAFPEDKLPVFQANVDAFLTDLPEGGVKFLAPTRSLVLWWSPHRED